MLGTWCVGDHPTDNEAYVGIARDQCGENEATLIIGENGYTWEREERLSCRYLSGKARFDNTIPASTKTVGVWVTTLTITKHTLELLGINVVRMKQH